MVRSKLFCVLTSCLAQFFILKAFCYAWKITHAQQTTLMAQKIYNLIYKPLKRMIKIED